MACYQKATNQLVTCPFDPAHRVLNSRLQMHIAKCKLNHLDKEMSVCPFNATHRYPQALMQDHIMKCPDRCPVDKRLASNLDKNNVFKGRTAVPAYSQPPPVPESRERWDLYPSPTAGYVPQAAPPKDGIINDLGLMKPAERKNFYRTSHTTCGPESEKDRKDNKSSQELLRMPRQKHEDIIQDKILKNSVNVGLGRGQVKSDSRIVANIFGGDEKESPKQEFRQPKSYRQVVAGLNNYSLGIGRGRGLPGALHNENFPALGLGRGVPAASFDLSSDNSPAHN